MWGWHNVDSFPATLTSVYFFFKVFIDRKQYTVTSFTADGTKRLGGAGEGRSRYSRIRLSSFKTHSDGLQEPLYIGSGK